MDLRTAIQKRAEVVLGVGWRTPERQFTDFSKPFFTKWERREHRPNANYPSAEIDSRGPGSIPDEPLWKHNEYIQPDGPHAVKIKGRSFPVQETHIKTIGPHALDTSPIYYDLRLHMENGHVMHLAHTVYRYDHRNDGLGVHVRWHDNEHPDRDGWGLPARRYVDPTEHPIYGKGGFWHTHGETPLDFDKIGEEYDKMSRWPTVNPDGSVGRDPES